ncbi:hypothetical protein V491_00012 [Pseudogymnoascus sp. VKM F-3775]|nr:hypothetical protein V491_00012 [Pseudogymnoascus sp. VKM F-3775]
MWEETQAATLFLRSLQRSFSTSIVQQEPALWKDKWERQVGPDKSSTTHQGLNVGTLSGRTGFGWFSSLFDWSCWRSLWKDRWERQAGPDRSSTTHQGLNVGTLSGRTGFGWFSSLFDWSCWRLKDQYVPLVLQENPRLLRHYQAKRASLRDKHSLKDQYVPLVLQENPRLLRHYQTKRASLRDKHSLFVRLQLVERWWKKYSSVVGVKLALVEYLCGLCIAEFRRDVWGFLLERKDVGREHKRHLMTADVPLCYHTLKLYLVDKEPWFVTGNKADVKTIPALAAYLFNEEPYAVDPERAKGVFKDRRFWDDKAYRIIFHRCLALLNRAANREWADLLDDMVKGSVSAQNYVLPYPDPGCLFTTTKRTRGRGADTEVKPRRIWAAVWVKDNGPVRQWAQGWIERARCGYGGETSTYLGRSVAYDANRIVKRAREEDILQIGGRLQANADVELAMPCTSLYTAEWHGVSNCELEDKLCHGTMYLADREAQIEATWRKRETVTRLDGCTQEYHLRVRLNTEKPEANNELDTTSSDSNSHQGRDDEWDSTLSSGGESEYNPKRRSRQHTGVNKRSGGKSGRGISYI